MTTTRGEVVTTDLFIHPKTKRVSVTMYNNNNLRKFEVFKEFKFGDFGLKEWDMMLSIPRKKKNKVVHDLINSLGNKYKELRTIGGSLQIDDQIDNLERQIIEGKLLFVDDDEKPLVATTYVDSECEVEVVFDETTNLMASASSKCGNDRVYGNNSVLEQLRETYQDDDYDPYDVDLYKSHDMFDYLQAICDNLDITVRGKKK
ncbi:hypothetical protein Tco_0276794 [Tanacetum coccineum]